jgi:hypothetical protein
VFDATQNAAAKLDEISLATLFTAGVRTPGNLRY